MSFFILIDKVYLQMWPLRQSLSPNVAFVVNLCLIMGKYHIHKQKWAKGKPLFFISDRNEKLL